MATKLKIIKFVQYFAGSSFIFVVLGYLCGYSIFTSFLKYLFNVSIVTGMIFPPSNIVFLGYVFMLSFVIGIPILWDLSTKRGLIDIEALIILFLAPPLFSKVNYSFSIAKYTISPTLFRIIVIFIAIIIYIFILRILFRKRQNRPTYFEKLLNYISIGTIIIFFGLLLPQFSHLRGLPENLNDINITSFMISFYIEYLYSLTFISISIDWGFKFIKSIEDYKKITITLFKLVVILLIFVYQFTTIIGEGIGNSYLKNNKGLFPEANIYLNTPIRINDKDVKFIKAYFLTKDDSTYYIFTIKPNKLYLINSSIVETLNVEK